MMWVFLAVIGFFVGSFGTILGVAGGFLLVPILLFLYPEKSPSTITAITLTVAFFNSISGSIAYTRLRRIDYYSGILFSLVAVPGAILGAYINTFLDRVAFQILFGIVLLLVSAYLFIRPLRSPKTSKQTNNSWTRKVIDIHGTVYLYSFNRLAGICIAFGIGIIAGLLGIGGGIIHVPVLTQVLNFPVHIATATSQFVVGTCTFSAGITRLLTGSFTGIAGETIILALGAVLGAQIGARLSRRIPGVIIIRILAVALTIVAVRLLVVSFF